MRRTPLPQELRDWIEVVVDDNADAVLRYLRRRVAEPEEAADLLGHVLLALWQNGSRIPTGDTDARMWCFGIARNVLREHFRHTVKRVALADELRDHLRDTTVQENAADSAAEANMRASEVRKAVASLDKRSRELVTLVHWDGFSIAEAARLLAINESTARTRYGRALQRLQTDLADPASDSESSRNQSQSGLPAAHASRRSPKRPLTDGPGVFGLDSLRHRDSRSSSSASRSRTRSNAPRTRSRRIVRACSSSTAFSITLFLLCPMRVGELSELHFRLWREAHSAGHDGSFLVVSS